MGREEGRNPFARSLRVYLSYKSNPRPAGACPELAEGKGARGMVERVSVACQQFDGSHGSDYEAELVYSAGTRRHVRLLR